MRVARAMGGAGLRVQDVFGDAAGVRAWLLKQRRAATGGVAMKLSDFKVMSFDCYGTLVDWESGILTALRPLLRRAGVALDGETILAALRGARVGAAGRDARHALLGAAGRGPRTARESLGRGR